MCEAVDEPPSAQVSLPHRLGSMKARERGSAADPVAKVLIQRRADSGGSQGFAVGSLQNIAWHSSR